MSDSNKAFKVGHGARAIADNFFYGREKELKSLHRNLRDGQDTLFIAPRQMGKTSLALTAIKRYEAKEPVITAHIDLWGVASFKEAGKVLIDHYMRDRYEINDFSKRILLSISDLAKQIIQKTSGIDIESALKNFKINHDGLDGGTYFIKVITLILDIERMRKQRVVLFIDEFQELSKFVDMTIVESDTDEKGNQLKPGQVFLKRLRALLQNSQNVILFAAGSEETLMKQLFGKTEQAFMKGAYPIQVTPIEFEAYESHFQAVCDNEEIELPHATVKLFYFLSGGIPYYLSFMGKQYVELVSDSECSTYDATLQSIQLCMRYERSFFDEKVSQIKSVKNGFLFYKSLSKRDSLTFTAQALGVDIRNIDVAKNGLMKKGFISKVGHGYYQPSLPLLYFYSMSHSEEIFEDLLVSLLEDESRVLSVRELG